MSRCAPKPVLSAAALAMLLLVGRADGSEPAQADAPSPRAARSQYLQYCSGCHLPDGGGAPASGVPALRERLADFLRIDGGRQYIVQVPGVMNTPLGDAETAALMNWLVQAMSPDGVPQGFLPYTASEVAVLRASRPHDIYAVRRALLAHPISPGS